MHGHGDRSHGGLDKEGSEGLDPYGNWPGRALVSSGPVVLHHYSYRM